MHLNSELIFRKHGVPFFKDQDKILEIGPAGSPSEYQKVVNNPKIVWHTIDFADTTFINSSTDNLTYKLTSPYKFPVEDKTYDIVLSGQVIEHVEKIWEWLKEIKRVTKDDGLIVTVNPVSWPYHEAPIDCWRIYPNGIIALAEEVGLDVVFCKTESLEIENLQKLDKKIKYIPGRSYNYTEANSTIERKISWNKFVRKLPFFRTFEIPIEVAFDTISVLRKK